jgi:hypothetical protein
MARAVAGAQRPPLPDRVLRRPPASTGRGGRRPGHLASRRVVPPRAQVQQHPATLPLNLVDLALAVLLAGRLEQRKVASQEWCKRLGGVGSGVRLGGGGDSLVDHLLGWWVQELAA